MTKQMCSQPLNFVAVPFLFHPSQHSKSIAMKWYGCSQGKSLMFRRNVMLYSFGFPVRFSFNYNVTCSLTRCVLWNARLCFCNWRCAKINTYRARARSTYARVCKKIEMIDRKIAFRQFSDHFRMNKFRSINDHFPITFRQTCKLKRDIILNVR